jgi:hypothetical protein
LGGADRHNHKRKKESSFFEEKEAKRLLGLLLCREICRAEREIV